MRWSALRLSCAAPTLPVGARQHPLASRRRRRSGGARQSLPVHVRWRAGHCRHPVGWCWRVYLPRSERVGWCRPTAENLHCSSYWYVETSHTSTLVTCNWIFDSQSITADNNKNESCTVAQTAQCRNNCRLIFVMSLGRRMHFETECLMAIMQLSINDYWLIETFPVLLHFRIL